jgi:transposase
MHEKHNQLFVGVDVSEGRFDVAYLDSLGQPVRGDSSFPNTPDGIRDLKGSIIACSSMVGKRPKISVGMEATSNFHKGLEQALRIRRPRSINIHVLNPFVVKQFKRMDLKVYKTDKLDAYMIARYLQKMFPKPSPECTLEQETLKTLTRLRHSLQEETTRFKNRLRYLLRIYFPGYKQYLGVKITRRMLVLFSQVASLDELLAMPTSEIAKIKVCNRHRVGEKFATKIILLAEKVPQKHISPGICMAIKWTAARIMELLTQTAEIDREISRMLDQQFPGHPLRTIPGLGPVSCAAILAETGNISRFSTSREFIGYIGLYPVVWESGQTKARFQMTIKGNKMLKMTFLVASAAARLYNPAIRQYYDRLRARGKSKKAAGGAIARKLACIVFTILKTGEAWSAKKALAGMEKGSLMAGETGQDIQKGNRQPNGVKPQTVVNATNNSSGLPRSPDDSIQFTT